MKSVIQRLTVGVLAVWLVLLSAVAYPQLQTMLPSMRIMTPPPIHPYSVRGSVWLPTRARESRPISFLLNQSMS